MRVSASYRPERGGWSGRILGWAEVDHLGAQARDLRVADDVRESVREVMIDAAPAVAVANGAQ